MNDEVNVWLEQVFVFLSKELSLLENELKKRLLSFTENRIDLHNIFTYFFEIRGKRLRPILVLLSAGLVREMTATSDRTATEASDTEIQLAAVVELIHNSSLIHDDIVDESSHRRGQKTMNHKFNNRIAVLAGDLLFSHGFLIMNKLEQPKISAIFTKTVETMCQSEINEIISPFANFEQYIAHLNAKTASLMSACCKSGAILAGADEKSISLLGEFGTNIGIAYQLMDDYLDDEQPKNFDINILLQTKIYCEKAKKNLENFKDCEYKKHLLNLVRYVIIKSELKQEKTQDQIV